MLFEKTTYLDDFPLSIRIISVTDYPVHYHQDIEFVYVLKGEVNLKDVSSYYVLKEGDIFTINGHEVHAMSATQKENVVAVIQVSNRFFTQYFPTLPKACFMTYVNDNKSMKLDTLRKMLLHILLDHSRKSFNYKHLCITQMIEVIKYINQHFNLFAFEDKNIVNFKNDNPVIIERISRIINYVYENHASKLTLMDLAEVTHLSTFYLSHLIREQMGISFQEFLCFARVEMSEINLLQTDHKISAITRDVGFSATSYYEKFFTKWFGHTPEEHREMFSPYILSEERSARFHILEENQAVSHIKRCLSWVSDQENCNSMINQLHLNVGVNADVEPIMEVHRPLEVVITHEDYNVMGERLFHLLHELNASKVILSLSPEDSETNSALLINRLNFLGYEVSTIFENGLPGNISIGNDSIAAVIQAFLDYFSTPRNCLHCKLRDQGESAKVLKGMCGALTSCLVPKPVFYAYRLLQNIKGNLLYWGKYYYVIKNETEIGCSYAIVVLNYNDDIRNLCTRAATAWETNDTINSFMDELTIDFTLPVTPGQYAIAKYALSNRNSVFSHMAHLGFPEKAPICEEWLHLLQTEPQTQISIEKVDNKLHINAAISGAGLNVIYVGPA